ncbi:MAG TPA: RNA polymerase sigma factor [Kofleriaceae bacterium]|nr:RNA polymerase sigma factor [Kofleriaceae bacterium]
MESRGERFRRLIEPIHDRVRAFARCLCRSRADGDDLFQEASLRAFTRLDGLRDDAAFRTWLYRVVISVHRNRCRRAFWRNLIPFGDRGELGDPSRAAASGELYRQAQWSPDAADATRRARAALAILPAAQREAIVLFEIDGWKVEEIAALHQVSASAVKSRLARGRDRLRAYYQKQLGREAVPAEST